MQDEGSVQSGVDDLHTFPGFTSVQVPSSKEMLSMACHLSTFSYSRWVTTADTWRHTQKGKKARERLPEALEVDRLARQELRGRRHMF